MPEIAAVKYRVLHFSLSKFCAANVETGKICVAEISLFKVSIGNQGMAEIAIV